MARTIAKDHEEKRAQILATAARLFATDGFDRTSMTRIARTCGISKSNIYHYYPGKDALLFDLLEGYLRGLRDALLSADRPGDPAAARLRAAIHALLRSYQGAETHHRVQMQSLSALPEDQQEVLRGYQREMVAHLGAILRALAPERLADAGRLRATTMSVFAMLNWYSLWNAEAGRQAREDYARLVADLVLDGIGGV